MPLDREEYIEQAYFFRTFCERLEENLPGRKSSKPSARKSSPPPSCRWRSTFSAANWCTRAASAAASRTFGHYFTPFQIDVMQKAEEDKSKFDQRTAFVVLEREARYRSESATPAGLSIYQFECLARNRLGYDRGLEAVAADPLYDAEWKDWLRKVRKHLGEKEFADLIYYRSEWYLEERRRQGLENADQSMPPVLFGRQEGRIAKANRGKEPLYLFAALQRQLVIRLCRACEDGGCALAAAAVGKPITAIGEAAATPGKRKPGKAGFKRVLCEPAEV